MSALSPGGTYSASFALLMGTQGSDSGPSNVHILKSSSTAVFWLSFSSSILFVAAVSSADKSLRRFRLGPFAPLTDELPSHASPSSASSPSSSSSRSRTVERSTGSGLARAFPLSLALDLREDTADARDDGTTDALRTGGRVLGCWEGARRSGGTSLVARAAADAALRRGRWLLDEEDARGAAGLPEVLARVRARELTRREAVGGSSRLSLVIERVRGRVARVGSRFCPS